MSETSAKQLERSQMALHMQFQQNQDALVSRIDAMLKPIQEQLVGLQAVVDAMGRQIDQIHERQESQERINAQLTHILENQEEKRILLAGISTRLDQLEHGT